jgi:hypothetical protein
VKIPCPQCGGEVHLREAEGFPACPFCGVGLVLDRTGVRPHVLYLPRIPSTEVLPLLRRWADQHRLAAAPAAAPSRLVYYPFWRYAREGPRRLIPAWSTLETHWDELRLPDAEQVFFDASHVQGATVVESTVPEPAARARAFGDGLVPEGDLVHLPVYEATIRLGEVRRCIAIEACSGMVVCSETALPQAAGSGAARVAWMAGVGSVMLAAAMVVRPLGVAALVVAALAALLYGVLVTDGRGGGG